MILVCVVGALAFSHKSGVGQVKTLAEFELMMDDWESCAMVQRLGSRLPPIHLRLRTLRGAWDTLNSPTFKAIKVGRGYWDKIHPCYPRACKMPEPSVV